MKSYFFTTGPNHSGGSGYWEVKSTDTVHAREKMWQFFKQHWSFQYDELEQIHPLDRKQHGIIL